MSKINKQQVPKIRFTGFSEDWMKNSLLKLTDRIGDGIHATPIYSDEGEIPFINGNNLVNNVIAITENTKKISSEELAKYNQYLNSRSLFISINGTIGNTAFYNNEKVLLGKSICYINVNDILNLNYCFYYLSSPQIIKDIEVSLTGSTIRNLSLKTIRSLNVNFPELSEQTQIGNFFQQLDKLIELQTRAVESAETYKKAMLQKMFPQKGEKVPRVRFAGFSGDWVTTYFKDVADVRRGLTYSPSDVVTDKKGIRVLRSSNIDEDTLVISDTDVFVSEDAVKISYIKMNEILITAANGSSRLVGKHAIISKDLERAVHGGFMLAVSTSQPEFINSWMNGVQYKKMLQLVQGGNGAIGNLSRSMLEECKITLPCLVEQEKIGNFFQKLDQNIESEKKKLEQYQTMKRAMLQRMFV